MALPPLAKLLAACLLASLAGCGVLAPQADPTRYFALKAAATGRLASTRLAVIVGPVTIPGYLDHKEIVTAGPANDLILADYHVWAETLEKAVSRVVAENVSGLLNSPAVVPFPDAETNYDLKATLIVRRFEMGPDHLVHLDASYSIAPAAGSPLAGSARSRTITVAVPQPENYSSIVDSMSRALAELSGHLARDLLAFERKRASARGRDEQEIIDAGVPRGAARGEG